MTIEVRILGPADTQVLEHLNADVFDYAVQPKLSIEFLTDPRHHLAVAMDGNVVVGIASAVDYVHPDKSVELWINEVGVAEEYQRQGIGRRLLQALFKLGGELGCKEAWVLTEHHNISAQKLYAAVNGEPAPVVMYSFKLSNNQ